MITWFVGFDSLQDARRVPLAVARALLLGEHSARDPLDFLADVLAETPALVVLDNCEHLIDAAAAFADELLDAVPQLTILATSRRRLDVDGEQVFAVPPLSLTDNTSRPSDALALLRIDVERAGPGPRRHGRRLRLRRGRALGDHGCRASRTRRARRERSRR
ncbi:hypothetical protein [Microbacterium binotii]|uniref:hypothetical protein n=1 Tax=Microbacterium binotii TaxID=462710 RepID=UPI0031DDD956